VGDVVRMHGFDVTTTAEANMKVTIHWEVLERTDEHLIVFVHLFDADGDFIVGHDGVPVDRTYPSEVWSPGEWISDTHTLSLSGGISPGEYQLATGMYRYSDLQRLVAKDAEGQRFSQDVIPLQQRMTWPPYES